MRIRHAMAAGSAVALLSAATTMMASATASAGVTAATAAPAPVATITQVGTASYGSFAGLVLGLLFVLLLAAVSFAVRVGSTRRAPARVVSVPEARMVVRHLTPAFAD